MFEKSEWRNIIMLDGLDHELSILFLDVITSIGNDVIDIFIVDDMHLRPNNTAFAVWSSTKKECSRRRDGGRELFGGI